MNHYYRQPPPFLAYGAPGEPFVRPGAKLGRNQPCSCGSGRKYKNCCADADKKAKK